MIQNEKPFLKIRYKNYIHVLSVVVIAIVMAACSNKDLSRRKAAVLISKHEDMTKETKSLPISDEIIAIPQWAEWEREGGLSNPEFKECC